MKFTIGSYYIVKIDQKNRQFYWALQCVYFHTSKKIYKFESYTCYNNIETIDRCLFLKGVEVNCINVDLLNSTKTLIKNSTRIDSDVWYMIQKHFIQYSYLEINDET